MTHLSFIIIKGISTILEHPSSVQGGNTGCFTITLTHAREKEFRNIEQVRLKGDFERASRGID